MSGAKRMITTRKSDLSLYVDRARSERWIVRDEAGRFWVVPPSEDGWEKRQEFHPGEDAELEPIPSHYLYMLGLPQGTSRG
jgi:hypothetical protein